MSDKKASGVFRAGSNVRSRSRCIELQARLLILALIVSSCGEASGPDEITIEATILAAASPTVLDAVVGAAVDNAPSVITQDSNGTPVSGAVVRFSVVSGGGAVAGDVVTSNSAGIARVGAWIMGQRPGPNIVTASIGSLASVTFRANAVVGPPATLIKMEGDKQVGPPNSQTPLRPRVRVIDKFGNSAAGVLVTFSIVAGGGELSGAAVISDSLGDATLGSWRLGPRREQSIIARSANVAAQTFSATAIIPFLPCGTENILPEDVTVQSELTSDSCKAPDGSFYERIQVTIGDPAAYLFTLASTSFDTYLELRDESVVAENNDRGSSTNSGIKALLRPGVYALVVTSFRPEAVGSYSISFKKVPEKVDRCEEVFIVLGIVTEQQSAATDCAFSQSEQSHRFRIYLKTGTTLGIRVDDLSYSDHGITLTSASGEVVASGANTSPYVYSLAFSVREDGYYTLDISNRGEFGAQYRMTVQ